MKTVLAGVALLLLATPATGFADPKIDFNAKCAKCHRATRMLPKTAGELGVHPGKLALRTSRMNREEMIAIIEKGRDKMPAFEKELSSEQIADLADYIILLKNRKKK